MYLNYLTKILKDKEPEGGGTGGEGGTPDLTVEELKNKIADLENQGTAKDGENSKLKKDLETLQKKLSKLENEGKTKEQLDKEEKEKIERELQEKTNEINLMKLEVSKAKLVAENKISEHFTDLIALSPEMTEEELKKVITNVAKKQEAFKNDLLKDYSITKTAEGTLKTENGKDFVDNMLENREQLDTDLTKFM
jgi:hypothetical protein